MTLQQLKYVIEISDKGSFSEAAKTMFITQPSLSGTVKELEKEIGFELFIRTNRGAVVTADGKEFLRYARHVIAQSDLLEQKFLLTRAERQRVSISTQHYDFAIDAFIDIVKEEQADKYDFSIRESRTMEIIEDVSSFSSEIGLLYVNDYNKPIISRILKEEHLIFYPVFTAKPHIFVSAKNPLAKKKSVKLEELEDYPCLCFEQGQKDSFYLSEELLNVTLMMGVNGYTISTGIINRSLNGQEIVSVPLEVEKEITVGYILPKNAVPSELIERYIKKLREKVCNSDIA
jgi:DNA-binding transcriptional LysR family regulator